MLMRVGTQTAVAAYRLRITLKRLCQNTCPRYGSLGKCSCYTSLERNPGPLGFILLSYYCHTIVILSLSKGSLTASSSSNGILLSYYRHTIVILSSYYRHTIVILSSY